MLGNIAIAALLLKLKTSFVCSIELIELILLDYVSISVGKNNIPVKVCKGGNICKGEINYVISDVKVSHSVTSLLVILY